MLKSTQHIEGEQGGCRVWSAAEIAGQRKRHAQVVKKIEDDGQRAREVLAEYVVHVES